MSDDDEIDILKEAKALNVGAVVPELYKDAISPAAKELGQSLKTVMQAVNISLRPVAGFVWGYEKIEAYVCEALTKRFKGKNTEEIIAPELHLAGPLLEALKYTGYQVPLRDMYVNLLATSMDRNTAQNAHPAFVDIVRQMSPDEAKLLRSLKNMKDFPDIDNESVPNYERTAYEEIKGRFSNICIDAGLSYPELAQSYLDNLQRLRIIEFGRVTIDTTVSEEYGELKVDDLGYEHLVVTSFGQQFIDACLDKQAS